MSETFEKISAVLDGEAAPDSGDLKVQRWHPQKTPIGTIVKPHSEGDFVTLEDHRAHVTRLQAEVAALQQRLNVADQRVDELTADNARLQAQTADVTEEMIHWQRQAEQIGLLNKANESELTKARELLESIAATIPHIGAQEKDSARSIMRRIEMNLARQSAPAASLIERGSTHGFEQSPNTCRHDEKSGVWWREGHVARTGRECNACGHVDEDPIQSATAAKDGQSICRKCWACRKPVTLIQWNEHDGHCPHCAAEIDEAEGVKP